jgi:hypothetical protein
MTTVPRATSCLFTLLACYIPVKQMASHRKVVKQPEFTSKLPRFTGGKDGFKTCNVYASKKRRHIPTINSNTTIVENFCIVEEKDEHAPVLIEEIKLSEDIPECEHGKWNERDGNSTALVCYHPGFSLNDNNHQLIPLQATATQRQLLSKNCHRQLNLVIFLLIILLLYCLFNLYLKVWHLKTTNKSLMISLINSDIEIEKMKRKYHYFFEESQKRDKMLKIETLELKNKIKLLSESERNLLFTSKNDKITIKSLKLELNQLKIKSKNDNTLIIGLKLSNNNIKSNSNYLQKEVDNFYTNATILELTSHLQKKENNALKQELRGLTLEVNKVKNNKEIVNEELQKVTLEKTALVQQLKELEKTLQTEQEIFATLKERCENKLKEAQEESNNLRNSSNNSNEQFQKSISEKVLLIQQLKELEESLQGEREIYAGIRDNNKVKNRKIAFLLDETRRKHHLIIQLKGILESAVSNGASCNHDQPKESPPDKPNNGPNDQPIQSQPIDQCIDLQQEFAMIKVD